MNAGAQGKSRSFWMMERMPQFAPLQSNTSAEICVIGAGIAGLTTAYLLARAGRTVVLLCEGFIGAGESMRTTAHLSYAIDDRYFEIERVFGKVGSRLAAESHRQAIDTIERIATDEGIACDFERTDGYLFATTDDDKSLLEKELGAVRRAGLLAVDMVSRAPLLTFDTGPALRFPAVAQIHPARYLNGLTSAFVRLGGRIFGRTRAVAINGGASAKVTAANGSIVDVSHIVVATNTPVNDRVQIHTKQAAYRSYVIGGLVPSGSVPNILLWDTAHPYHYVRTQRLNADEAEGLGAPSDARYDLLIVGGEDHKTGQFEAVIDPFDNLEAWTRRLFPQMEKVVARWSGQVMETADGLAFLGRNPGHDSNVFIITGDSGMGFTHGTIGGLLISDLIEGRENPWEKLYDPSRMEIKAVAGKRYIKENANALWQYSDWITGGESRIADEEKLMPGQGAIESHGLGKVAVYCDENGKCHRFNARCPHMNGVVQWNPVEKSWDCPVHGSRFNALGQLLNGPANRDLMPEDEEERKVS